MAGTINGYGGPGRRKAMSSVDFYRRVPKEFTEATALGATMSVCAMLVMALLFFAETMAFARTKISTEIALDENADSQLQLNFNVTLFALHCDYASVDVWDVLGTNRQNVTKNVEKWQVDENGNRKTFSGRNRETREVRHEEHEETLEELHEDGVHVNQLSSESYDRFLQENELTFINYFAPWCMWCQRLQPTWEKFAEAVEEKQMPVGVASVDCVENAALCRKAQVMAFPTLRWFDTGIPKSPDYKLDRTVYALTNYAKRQIDLNAKYRDWESKNKGQRHPNDHRNEGETATKYVPPENPGCQISGTLMVNRVPGNFHIEAKSVNHNLNAAMTNLTHRVNHLSFGPFGKNPSRMVQRAIKQIPEDLQQFKPLDDHMFTTDEFHQAYHHYIKVVSTHLKMASSKLPILYQFVEQSQVVQYDVVNVPEARFSYDLSPMSVVVEKEGRKWYDYLTSLCAIIGGTFTTLGLIDATLYKVFKPKKL